MPEVSSYFGTYYTATVSIRFSPWSGAVMNSSNRLVESPSRKSIELFHETRLVRITLGGFAIWIDPFGMLDPQIVVNLFPELGVGMDSVRHGNLLW